MFSRWIRSAWSTQHRGHAARDLADLLERPLDQPLVADRRGDEPDLAAIVTVVDVHARQPAADLVR
jgi:hypothetical protein